MKPNSVTLIGLVVTDSETWIVTDFADHGNLENFAKVLERTHKFHVNPITRKANEDEHTVSQILHQIMSGLMLGVARGIQE